MLLKISAYFPLLFAGMSACNRKLPLPSNSTPGTTVAKLASEQAYTNQQI
jgi:hypothetical protein